MVTVNCYKLHETVMVMQGLELWYFSSLAFQIHQQLPETAQHVTYHAPQHHTVDELTFFIGQT